jgi:coenzyme F420-reducing hydrogenase beta subunit
LTHRSENQSLNAVISGGYCIGCAACTRGEIASPLSIELDAYGCLQAKAKSTAQSIAAVDPSVCPFSETALSEDTLGKTLFCSDGVKHDSYIGHYRETWAGYVVEGKYCEQGSSGGFASWVLNELLAKDLVDAVIHVKPRQPDGQDRRLFVYAISRTATEILSGAKSHYYPIEMSEVLRLVRETPGRYAIVGLPCFIKALRLLAHESPVFADRIVFCVGLFCGHLKSTGFSESYAWQCGIRPDQLRAVDFRRKQAGKLSSQYGVGVIGLQDGHLIERTASASDLFGSDWGLGLFKYKACDYCDDVVAETADVSIGDAWLPEYVSDYRGTNVVIVRSLQIATLIHDGIRESRLALQEISAERIIESQAAGFRHRREGLAYRLYLADRTGKWRPHKRVQPCKKHLTRRLRRRFELRQTLAAVSHIAFLEAISSANLSVFYKHLHPLVDAYYKTYQALPRRVVSYLKSAVVARIPRRLKQKLKELPHRRLHSNFL